MFMSFLHNLRLRWSSALYVFTLWVLTVCVIIICFSEQSSRRMTAEELLKIYKEDSPQNFYKQDHNKLLRQYINVDSIQNEMALDKIEQLNDDDLGTNEHVGEAGNEENKIMHRQDLLLEDDEPFKPKVDLENEEAFEEGDLIQDLLNQGDKGKNNIQEEDDELKNVLEVKKAEDKALRTNYTAVKYILFWNEFYPSHATYDFCCGEDPFIMHGCPIHTCQTTANRSLLGGVEKFDALLFHQAKMDLNDLPEKRSPHQRYVMVMIEPATFKFFAKPYNNFFNWTFTYRQDSDFVHGYGAFIKTKEHPTEERQLQKLIKNFGEKNRHLAKGKTKKVTWFVSHCKTDSAREEYVAALKQYIGVDIYGKCGVDICSCGNNTCGGVGDCFKKVEADYKFYITFENSICLDYVTEKFFDSTKRPMIPLTLGGANYAQLSPVHSHVSVLPDYPKPADLADYLLLLDQNDSLFAEYFWWKEYYTVSNVFNERVNRFCDLCERLHSDFDEKVYEDMEEWWHGQARCRRMDVV